MTTPPATETTVCPPACPSPLSPSTLHVTRLVHPVRRRRTAPLDTAPVGILVHDEFEGDIYATQYLVCQSCGTGVYGPQVRGHLVGDRVQLVGNHRIVIDDATWTAPHGTVATILRAESDGSYYVQAVGRRIGNVYDWRTVCITVNPNATRMRRVSGGESEGQ